MIRLEAPALKHQPRPLVLQNNVISSLMVPSTQIETTIVLMVVMYPYFVLTKQEAVVVIRRILKAAIMQS